MVCKNFLLLHFKSGKISVIIFLGPLLMELHILFMNANETVVSAEVKTKPKKAHACKHCDKSYTQSHNLK